MHNFELLLKSLILSSVHNQVVDLEKLEIITSQNKKPPFKMYKHSILALFDKIETKFSESVSKFVVEIDKVFESYNKQ